MSWLIESYLLEDDEIKKEIEAHKKDIKDIDEVMKYKIAKIDYDADKRITNNPEKADGINKVRKLKILSIKKAAEVYKDSHRKAIDNLQKQKKGNDE